MKNTLVADSSFGTLPAPFCEFPADARVRRSGSELARAEWSPLVRIAIVYSVIPVLMIFLGVASLLKFAFEPRVDAPTNPRVVHEPPARETSVYSTEGDTK